MNGSRPSWIATALALPNKYIYKFCQKVFVNHKG